jgi:DDE superfamily endonuclease
MAAWKLPIELSKSIAALAGVLDARNACRLRPMLTGLLFARGRRTVSSWLRAIGVRRHYEDYYYFLASLGRKCESVAGILLLLIVRQLRLSERVLFALDDSPTKRYGPKVEGAGLHHNPTPGPADAKFLYGHVWVTLTLLRRHPKFGTIGLPLLARLYVRAKDIWLLWLFYRWQFRTKLELAAELVEWLAKWLQSLGKSLWIVTDGAYAKRPFLNRAQAAGVTVVSRLRKDAALYTVPRPPRRGARRRGRPRKYGTQRIDLAKRAGQTRGWQSGQFALYGKQVTKRYKTLLATYPPAGGLIRVVLVKNEDGSWVAYFCTDTSASVASMLEAVADRAAIEQVFHDVKEVHGAGQQQLRNVWANIAAWNMQLWLHTLVELWAWNQSQSSLCDRGDSPWDDAARRPSHADRCKALRQECLETEFTRHAAAARWKPKIRAFVCRLAKRAA